jgi:UDP-glucose 4-epimerase
MILITGAAGFIGSNLSNYFNQLGFETVTIDNLSTGIESNIPPETLYINGDCSDDKTLSKLDSYSIEGIIHIAGQSSAEISFAEPSIDLNSNLLSTLKLLEYARKKGIKKFVYASSMAVYGEVNDLPVSESHDTIPKSFYGISKLSSESYLRLYSQFGIEITVLRFFNVYGPGQNLHNMKQGMLSIYLAQAFLQKKVTVKGSSGRFRDFIYIRDVIEAIKLSYFKNTGIYNVFNVCCGRKTTVHDLILLLTIKLDIDFPVKYVDGTPGDQYGIYGDYSLINTKLNWSPKTNLEAGIEETIEWLKSIYP